MKEPTGGRWILVVDDEPDLRRLLTAQLSSAGYRVTACADGHEGLAALGAHEFDAVLSDIQMPDMDGLALLRAVRELDLDLPVILQTGGPSLESSLEAIEWGALQYLVKPVPLDRLLSVVGRAVRLGDLARLKREALVATGSGQLVGDRAGLESAFHRALAGLRMAYQPIVDADDDRVEGYEALMRTSEPLLPDPGSLLGAAERLSGLRDLGAAVRGQVARLLDSNAAPARVFLNLHPQDLSDERLLDPSAPLSRHARRIVLEITERATLDHVADVAGRVRALRDMGFQISIDDLGAGYAGLTNLATLAPDIVKFDMSLIRGMDRDVVRRKLVGSMAAVCRDLGIRVVAEGIETEAERRAAVDAGCDLLQGFLIGRPDWIPAVQA